MTEPKVEPLVLYTHGDFQQILTFTGLVNPFPPGTTITYHFYDSTDPEAEETASWPGELTVDGAKWSVDHVLADAISTPGGYRVIVSQPNPSDTANPTVESVVALGKLTRK